MPDHCHSVRPSEYPNLEGKTILVVEDDAVTAIDYHFQLKDVGAKAAGFTPSNRAALDYLATHEVDAAIVDYELHDGASEPVMRWLENHGIPFIVVSGCLFEMHGRVIGPQVVSKPATPTDVCTALSAALH